MKINILLIICSFLFSCTSQKKVMDSWIGRSQNDVILAWGSTPVINSDGAGGKIMIYSQPFPVHFSNQIIRTYKYTYFYIDSTNVVYKWKFR